MVLNGGDFANGQLILTGGKSNGTGISPFIDIVTFTFSADSSVLQVADEKTHFFADVGHRFDDAHLLSRNDKITDLVVSKYETNKMTTSSLGSMDINRVSILRIRVDSIPNIVWENHPAGQLITAFYSLADRERTSAYLFSLDTAGEIKTKQKIGANELTYLSDTYVTKEGIYFCGSTEVGISSPLLGFGRQGLLGFVSQDGKISLTNVGEDKQGHYLNFTKIVADESLLVYDLSMTENLFLAGSVNNYWRMLEFKKDMVASRRQ
jgi:hypothetical protein